MAYIISALFCGADWMPSTETLALVCLTHNALFYDVLAPGMASDGSQNNLRQFITTPDIYLFARTARATRPRKAKLSLLKLFPVIF